MSANVRMTPGPLVVYVGGEVYCLYEKVRAGDSLEVHCPKCEWVQVLDLGPRAPFQFQHHAQHCVDAHLEWVRAITCQASVLGIAIYIPGAGFLWRDKEDATLREAPMAGDEELLHAFEVDNHEGTRFTIHLPRIDP